ncbi:MAG: acetolactate synthase regulatory subunit [Gammaproteobacteria bacterium]|jgi:acetolactate synthase regulatory subunit
MDTTHLFELQAQNAPSILPRICLVLSRRRITPLHLSFAVSDDAKSCTLEITIECDRNTANRLQAQLARVVELTDISMRPSSPQLLAADTGAAA